MADHNHEEKVRLQVLAIHTQIEALQAEARSLQARQANLEHAPQAAAPASARLPTPPLFSNDESDRGRAGYTDEVFEWAKRMHTYAAYYEPDEGRQAQLAINY